MMPATPWWERFPIKYEKEIQRLNETGFDFFIDEDLKRQGILKIRVNCPHNGDILQITAVYPEEYPFFRVNIYCDNIKLEYHQNPISGMLCTLDQSGDSWQPEDDTLALMLTEQLPKIFLANNNGGFCAAPQDNLEVPQGEPFSTYPEYAPGSIMMIDETNVPDEYEEGLFKYLVWNDNKPIRGIVTEICDLDSKLIQKCNEHISNIYAKIYDNSIKKGVGYWTRQDLSIRISKPRLFIEDILKKAKQNKHNNKSSKFEIFAALIPENVKYGHTQDGWIFAARPNKGKLKPSNNPTINAADIHFVRPDRVAKSVLEARIPDLAPLRDKKVAVIGLGMLGSECAIQLARAGVQSLVLVDHDIVEAGTTVRWELGFDTVGHHKAPILAYYINRNYPYTTCGDFAHLIGGTSHSPPPLPEDSTPTLEESLADCNLILDATASAAVHNYLAWFSKDLKIPHLVATGSAGGYGGMISLHDPNDPDSGCWQCLMHAIDSDNPTIPPANAAPASLANVQPPGCSSITSTGAGFDFDQIAINAVRLAAGFLCSNEPDGYPMPKWNVGVLKLRNKDGSITAPQWETHNLGRGKDCYYDL